MLGGFLGFYLKKITIDSEVILTNIASENNNRIISFLSECYVTKKEGIIIPIAFETNVVKTHIVITIFVFFWLNQVFANLDWELFINTCPHAQKNDPIIVNQILLLISKRVHIPIIFKIEPTIH